MAKAIPFTQQMQIKEAHVRGVYLAISCDYERAIADIITNCERPNYTEEERLKYNNEQIRHLTMGKKLGRLKDCLKSYPFYYKVNKPHFATFKQLLNLRNMLAHGYSEYDEANNDTSFIDFNYIDDTHKEKTKRIIIFPFLLELEQYRKGILALMHLAIIVLNVKNPV